MQTIDTNPTVDVQTYQLLEELMGELGFEEVIQVFRDDTRSALKHIAQALQTGQTDVIHAICHRLKSSSKLIGAMHLAELVTRLESYPQNLDTSQAQWLLQQANESFAEVQDWLDKQQAKACL